MVDNINPYLVNALNVMVERRTETICNVSEMVYGNKPTDGGNLILNKKEKILIIKENKTAKKWIRPFIGAEEFLNSKRRWCLWLLGANPSELRKCKLVMDRIEKVKKFRLNSKKISTCKLAATPTLFGEIRQTRASNNNLVVPITSSEKRCYIPMDFLSSDMVLGNTVQIIPDSTLYDFGVLESSVHMSWLRAVAGRLEMRYSYSGTLVYNNFIWPKPTPKQKEDIEKAAQAVLDARKLYPESTLGDLYDPNTMPPELAKAHERLDKTVKTAYGTKGFETEEEIVASLMKLYKEAIDKENATKRKIS